jgi:nitroimidazol reductase NimA-like FMN-containing flavoprotein (pyridoxamine 5'-phosphate oxidase superfamily)
MDCVNELIQTTPETPCSYSWRYDSVMGSGNVEFIEDEAGKAHTLNRMLQHLDKPDAQYNFPPHALAKTCVFQVRSNDFTGKHLE